MDVIIYSIVLSFISNVYILNKSFDIKFPIIIMIVLYFLINIFPSFLSKKLLSKKLSNTRNGYKLLEIFLISTSLSIVFLFLQIFKYHIDYKIILLNILFIFLFELVIFWNGIIRVYITSNQIGIKYRVIGIAVGWIPIINLIALFKIISIAKKEVKFENDKLILNESRKDDQICKTKYPILLVHGVFFRDFKYFDYWGRIPKELEKNGATIYYGNHSSALSVKDSAEELAQRIKEILKETGSKKVNIIAHSKGGLDSRYAISNLGMDKYVASLTMINTPNRGCEFADYLLNKAPEGLKNKVSAVYNSALKKFKEEPDFMSAVTDLTHSSVEKLNKEMKKSNKVYYKSVGSKLEKATSGRFPLNLTNNFVKHFDGFNDGLVGEESFKYGNDYIFLTPKKKRGISHGDMIDLNRENIDGFDVREFYVNLVKELKEKGF